MINTGRQRWAPASKARTVEARRAPGSSLPRDSFSDVEAGPEDSLPSFSFSHAPHFPSDTSLLLNGRHIDMKPSDDSWLERSRGRLRDDFLSICLLLFLYVLQGIPLGLIAAIPLILQGKKATFGDQAIFSLAWWPFSLKLLWAPFVDSFFFRRLGRRKSWLVPCQYLIGIFMLVLAHRVPRIIDDNSKPPDAFGLFLLFLPLNFLAATQDIAVDGWALTMLSRKNVGYASTCNAVGQAFGIFLGNAGFLTLESADFANTFLRSAENQKDHGVVDFAGFASFWGWTFIVATTMVLVFKKEVDNSVVQREEPLLEDEEQEEELELGIFGTYTVLLRILRLKPMLNMILILLTAKIAFAATDAMTDLKLIEAGVPRDRLASLGAFLTPLQIVFPWLIGKYTAGPRPLNVYLRAFPYKIFMGFVYAFLVWWTPTFRDSNGKYPFSLYFIWFVAYFFQELTTYSMFVSKMAFNAQISEPRIGGTYMTLLNTLGNLGSIWPTTLILSLTDRITWRDCMDKIGGSYLFSCHTKVLAEECKTKGGVCETQVDGYYLAVLLCSIFGVFWFLKMRRQIQNFQRIPRSDWSVNLRT